MKREIVTVLLALFGYMSVSGQIPGYYNGAEGKDGEQLKSALNSIISGHVDFSYSDAKYLMNYADADPANESNVILIYTRRSQSNTSWGSGSNDINREHVWAKSHGDFETVRPMDGDVFNLHPSDASVNITKSNLDFDECSDAGTYISEADAYYTSSQFEPADAAKGEVARTIFYMAVRYEGNNGELDLETVDKINTYPAAEHGKLSTLLQWNRDFPPSDFERRRNERIYEMQNNRNPFIDNPEFADLIWGGVSASSIIIGNVMLGEEYPESGTTTTLSAVISGNTQATLYLGLTWDAESQSSVMTKSGDTWTGSFDLSSFSAGDMVYFKIEAGDGTSTEVLRGTYRIPGNGNLTSISAIQGTGTTTPLSGSTVTLGGIVTASFDNSYYIQNGTDPRNGICIYDVKRGNIGDSVIVTGKPTEYNNLTEIGEVSYFYIYEAEKNIEPKVITIPEANEDYEGMLVTIENVTFLEGDAVIPISEAMTLNFTDGSNSMTVYSRYNSRLGGETVPSGTVNVTGVVSQYQGTYQLLVNSIDDIVAGTDNEAPLLTGVVVNDANWIEVSFSEKIEKTSAETLSNYNIGDNVTISGAYLYNDTKVLLYVSGLQVMDYTLTVTNVADLRGNQITSATMNFHSDYTSVGISAIIENSIRIYPNPAKDVLHIDFQNSNSESTLYITDLSGRILQTENISAMEVNVNIDLNSYSAGTYFVTIYSDGNRFHNLVEIVK